MTRQDLAFHEMVDEFWALQLGIADDVLRSDVAQVCVAKHLMRSDLCAMEFGRAPVLALSERAGQILLPWLTQNGNWSVMNPGPLCDAFGEQIGNMIGPAFLGYVDRAHFRPEPSMRARPLSSRDVQAVWRLKEACTPKEWEHGGGEWVDGQATGVFSGERLTALASFELWGDRIAHISIITDPACRGRGDAIQAVSHLTAMALERDLIPQYRTLLSNAPSMAIARRLGFQAYATSLVVYLK